MEDRKLKRIGRVARGETIVADMLQEDLIDMFEKMHRLKDDAERAGEEFTERRKDVELAKAAEVTDYESEIFRKQFWHVVTVRYELWGKNVGVRDGYAVVIMKGTKGVSGMPNGLKRILRQMLEDEEDGDGQFKVEE